MGDPGGVDWPKHAARLADQLLKAKARIKALEQELATERAEGIEHLRVETAEHLECDQTQGARIKELEVLLHDSEQDNVSLRARHVTQSAADRIKALEVENAAAWAATADALYRIEALEKLASDMLASISQGRLVSIGVMKNAHSLYIGVAEVKRWRAALAGEEAKGE